MEYLGHTCPMDLQRVELVQVKRGRRGLPLACVISTFVRLSHQFPSTFTVAIRTP